MKFKYTKQVHVSMLKRIMSTGEPEIFCPVHEAENLFGVNVLMRDGCPVCKGFIGLKIAIGGACPCNRLGVETCMERTNKALKKGGYIK